MKMSIKSIPISYLSRLGYKEIRPYIFCRRQEGSKIEHFLYFWTYGGKNKLISADFGIRYQNAELFSIDCIRAYGGELYQAMRHDGRVDCKMRFSFGKLAGWSPRWSLYVQDTQEVPVVKKVENDIDKLLIPFIMRIQSKNSLFTLLSENAEPCPWYHVNAAIRIAQIIYIGNELQMEQENIFNIARFFKKELISALGNACDPDKYIENVMNESVERRN